VRFAKGDWVADDMDRIARVQAVYDDPHGDCFDLVMYDRTSARQRAAQKV
jgi:hypothetical protein